MNDILQEFKIVFGFDDKPLQDGIKKTQGTLQGFGKMFGSLVASFVSFQAIKAATVDFANFNVSLKNNTSLLGLNIEEVSALGGALERFGGNTDSAISSLRSLSGHLEEAKRGSGALVEVSRKYGISFNPFGNANDTLLSLSKQMGKFSSQQRLAIAQQLGLDDSLTRAFADGGKELDRQIEKQKKWGTATEEDAKISNDFNNAQLDLKNIFGSLMRDFARVILPAFSKLIDLFSSFIEWVRDHKQLVIIFFGALLVAMTPVLIILGKIAFASALAFKPFATKLAILAGIALIIEDIYGYFMGWDTVTGDLVKKFPALGLILEPARVLAVGFSEAFEKAVEWLKDPSWEKFIDIIKTIGKAIDDFFGAPIQKIIDGFNAWLNSVKNVGKMFGGWLGGGNEVKPNIPDHTQVPQIEQIPQAPQVPLMSSTTSNQTKNNYQVNNNFNQNITTATPKQFADSTNNQIVNSITDIRQQNGAL